MTIFPIFSELRTTKNYAVQLEKYTARQFRDKGREHPESYFHFPQWDTAAWDNYKRDIGEGYSPIDKIEGKYLLIYVMRPAHWVGLFYAIR